MSEIGYTGSKQQDAGRCRIPGTPTSEDVGETGLNCASFTQYFQMWPNLTFPVAAFSCRKGNKQENGGLFLQLDD